MRTIMSIIAGGVLTGAVLLAGPALADSKMQQCAAQWQQMKAANKTGGQTYKDFSSQCMKGTAAEAASAAKPAPAATPAKIVIPTPAASVAKPASTTAGNGKTTQNNKMKDCAAQWNQMKAQNKTNGMTYKQWSSKCLKG